VIDVDSSSFFAIVLVAAIAATTVAIVPKGLAPPVVVLELILGIVIGPEVLNLAHRTTSPLFFWE
jgi:Kef-type K+ transport system membrane component KefB